MLLSRPLKRFAALTITIFLASGCPWTNVNAPVALNDMVGTYVLDSREGRQTLIFKKGGTSVHCDLTGGKDVCALVLNDGGPILIRESGGTYMSSCDPIDGRNTCSKRGEWYVTQMPSGTLVSVMNICLCRDVAARLYPLYFSSTTNMQMAVFRRRGKIIISVEPDLGIEFRKLELDASTQ